MEIRDFFFHWHHHFSAPPACNTHTHTHTHTAQHIPKEPSKNKDPGSNWPQSWGWWEETEKIHYEDSLRQLKTSGWMWWELILRRFKAGNRRRRTGWKIWRVKGTHKTGKSCPVFGGLLVHVSYIHVYPTLGNTPTSCAVMKCEESLITWFSEIVEGKDFRDLTHLPYCAQNPCHRT